jgi:hypothetical protein
MAKLIIVSWRDIPAQVIAKKGRTAAKAPLSSRFQVAIDRAAMRAGKGSSDEYLADWQRTSSECDDDIDAVVATEAARLESAYSDEALERLVKNNGVDASKAGAATAADA